MDKKILVIFTTFLFLTNIATFATSLEITKETEITEEDDWYYLPAYPNYAPCGLPDFSQKQQEDWKNFHDGYDLCGAVSLANILWWFDSRHSDMHGTPGDGKDTYPLVQAYHKTTPDPGPYPDDHNFNNVNDNSTPWSRFIRRGELIERIGFYTNRYKDVVLFKYVARGIPAFLNSLGLIFGAKRIIREANLRNSYSFKLIMKPDFSEIDGYIRNDSGIILALANFNDKGRISAGHFVSVAGINSSGEIAFSDPLFDISKPSSNETEHNDAGIVSHDTYAISTNSEYPQASNWWIPSYSVRGAYILYAFIISDQI